MSNEPSIPSIPSLSEPHFRLGRALHQNTLTVTSLGRWTATPGQPAPCLIERLRPEFAKNPVLRTRFLTLARHLYTSPTLPSRTVLAVEDTPYPDVALILGQTNATPLSQLITDLNTTTPPLPPPLPTKLALLITDLVCNQLQTLHTQLQTFHGLLDPNLVSITPSGRVFLDSVPAAVCAHEFNDLIHDPLTVWSHEGQRWIAPEVCYGRGSSNASDIYFIGALLYRLITKKSHGEEWQPEWSLFMADLSGAGIDGQHLTSMVRLLHRCLAERPNQRLRSIADVRKELDTLGLYGQQNRLLGDLQLYLTQLQTWSRTRWAQDHTEAADHQHTVGKTRVSSSQEAIPRPPSARTRPTSTIPNILSSSRYRVLEEIGEGGMGTVFKVFDTELREELALKVLRQDLIERTGWLERFRRELRLTRELAHPHIIPAYHLESIQGLYFYTMKYIDGHTLKHLIQTQGPLPVQTAVRILCFIADALTRAHSLGVVHRDLKCSNIMLQSTHTDIQPYHPFLMDFGIAADLSANQLTAAGQLLGTPQYMAPEQAMGETIQPAADLYSFAIVLYETIAGTPPFRGETAVAIYDAQVREDYIPLHQLFPDIHPDLSDLLVQCMRPKPEARPASMQSMYETLHAILPQLSDEPLRPTFSLSPDEITPCA